MASAEHTAQFQEPPPMSPLPTHSASDASKTPAISTQFQEPLSSQNANDVSRGSKAAAGERKERVQKPLVQEDEVKSPELEAAEEVLRAKGMM